MPTRMRSGRSGRRSRAALFPTLAAGLDGGMRIPLAALVLVKRGPQ
jgi:hypothetical protein